MTTPPFEEFLFQTPKNGYGEKPQDRTIHIDQLLFSTPGAPPIRLNIGPKLTDYSREIEEKTLEYGKSKIVRK